MPRSWPSRFTSSRSWGSWLNYANHRRPGRPLIGDSEVSAYRNVSFCFAIRAGDGPCTAVAKFREDVTVPTEVSPQGGVAARGSCTCRVCACGAGLLRGLRRWARAISTTQFWHLSVSLGSWRVSG